MRTIALVLPDIQRRRALAEQLRGAGFAVALVEDAAALPEGLRPEILVVDAALQVRDRQALVGHLSPA